MGISSVVAVLLIVMTVQSQQLAAKNAAYAEKEATLEKQLEQEEARSEEIAEMEEYMQSKEYTEKVAKDKLGLVYEDEIIFKPEG